MKRFHVRFYRLKENPDDKASWFEHDILGENEVDMMWKMNSIIHNHEVNGGKIFKTKVLSVKDEPPKERRKFGNNIKDVCILQEGKERTS